MHSKMSLDVIFFELWDTESSSIATKKLLSTINIAESNWQVMDSHLFFTVILINLINYDLSIHLLQVTCNSSYHNKSVHQKVNRQISMALFVKQLNLRFKLQMPEINQMMFVFSK